MKVLIGNAIIEKERIERVSIDRRHNFLGFRYVDVDVLMKRPLPQNALVSPLQFDYQTITVATFRGRRQEEKVSKLIEEIYTIINQGVTINGDEEK
ncbi:MULTISPECIES: hypothetical protein [Erysipelothrix]|uniref:hypothetical protein n=1 Tax=Erysipelothrix TaxID=1647 RepID=UPI00135748BF|nr:MULTISPECIES: hypothetical protein [Erysipelothrix]